VDLLVEAGQPLRQHAELHHLLETGSLAVGWREERVRLGHNPASQMTRDNLPLPQHPVDGGETAFVSGVNDFRRYRLTCCRTWQRLRRLCCHAARLSLGFPPVVLAAPGECTWRYLD